MKLNEITANVVLTDVAKKRLETIFVDETGSDYVNDAELLSNVIKAVKSSNLLILRQLSDERIKKMLDDYVKQMEDSGDWD